MNNPPFYYCSISSVILYCFYHNVINQRTIFYDVNNTVTKLLLGN